MTKFDSMKMLITTQTDANKMRIIMEILIIPFHSFEVLYQRKQRV